MESSRGGRVDVFRQRAFLRHPGMRVCSFSKMRLIATVAEKPPPAVECGQKPQKPHLGDFGSSSIPHEMSELGRRLFRVYGTALALQLGTRTIHYVRQHSFLS